MDNREQVVKKPLHIFCCYARSDQSYLLELNKRLIPLQREGLITIHADIDISPGEEWEQKVHHYLNTAHVILLLVSSDFIASEYCYSKEMKRALERHNEGNSHIIPIILRPVNLRRVPFGKIQSLPTDAKPITSWANQDDAFLDVVNGIEAAIEKLLSKLEEINNQAISPTPSLGSFPAQSPQVWIGCRIEEGEYPGDTYEGRRKSFSIGRSDECNMCLRDLTVSLRHASITNMGNGHYVLKDEGSANGTKLNGQLVNRFQTYLLREDDRIQLGQTVLVFFTRLRYGDPPFF